MKCYSTLADEIGMRKQQFGERARIDHLRTNVVKVAGVGDYFHTCTLDESSFRRVERLTGSRKC